jgi:hypothetical protein
MKKITNTCILTTPIFQLNIFQFSLKPYSKSLSIVHVLYTYCVRSSIFILWLALPFCLYSTVCKLKKKKERRSVNKSSWNQNIERLQKKDNKRKKGKTKRKKEKRDVLIMKRRRRAKLTFSNHHIQISKIYLTPLSTLTKRLH